VPKYVVDTNLYVQATRRERVITPSHGVGAKPNAISPGAVF